VIHLISRRTGDGVEVHYSGSSNETICFEFARTVIGMVYPEPSKQGGMTHRAYACMLAERTRPQIDDDVEPIRYFVCLDEVDTHDVEAYYQNVIAMKDKYLCDTVFCPKSPRPSFEALRDLEGLSFYPNESAIHSRVRYPGFVDHNTTASIQETDLPNDESVLATINAFLRKEVIDPYTRFPVLAAKHQSVYRLMLPDGANNRKAREALATKNMMPIRALWLAAQGLEASTSWQFDNITTSLHQPGSAGY